MIDATGALARALFEALHPLRDALADPATFQQLLLDLGYEVEVSDAALAALEAPGQVAGLVDQGETLVARLDELLTAGAPSPSWRG
jgi:hypothetical protein